MANKDDIDFALFADSIIEEETKQIKTGKKKLPSPIGSFKATELDISEVETSDKLVNTLLKESFGVDVNKSEDKPKQAPKQQVVEQKTKSVEEYTLELVKLINQAKNLINEMTTCGSIGVNMATSTPVAMVKKKKKKRSKLNGVLSKYLSNKG